MTIHKQYNFGGSNNPLGSYGGLVILILFFVLLYFVAKGIFTILSFAAPVLFLASLLIDYTATIDFFKFIVRLFKNNVLVGILAVLLVVVGYPIVAGFLFFRSIIRRKLKGMNEEMKQRQEGQYADYEILEENVEESVEEDFLELPELEKEVPKEDSEYDDLFK